MIASTILVALFLFDDFKGLKAYLRLGIQSALTLFMIFSTDTYISNLGNILGFGDLELGLFSIPFTVFCVVGIMNAFNMIDGINGLCSGCAMVALLFIGFSSGLIYDSMLVLLIGSMIGFLFFNLEAIFIISNEHFGTVKSIITFDFLNASTLFFVGKIPAIFFLINLFSVNETILKFRSFLEDLMSC